MGGSSSSGAQAGGGDKGSSSGSNYGAIRTGGKRPVSASGALGNRRPLSANTANRPTSAGIAGFDQRAAGGSVPVGGVDIPDTDLEIHETPEGQVYIKDLTLVPVKSIQEVVDVINLGVRLRETHQTQMNQTSSRSHTVFTEVVLECWILAAQWEIQAPGKVCFDAGSRLEQ
jgi:hypothetical protein